MKTLDHPTGLQNGDRVRFIGPSEMLVGWPTHGEILWVRCNEKEESEFKSLDYHHIFDNGHEFVWCIRKNKSQCLARREDLEAL